jgi:hypothetical protein
MAKTIVDSEADDVSSKSKATIKERIIRIHKKPYMPYASLGWLLAEDDPRLGGGALAVPYISDW